MTLKGLVRWIRKEDDLVSFINLYLREKEKVKVIREGGP